MTTARVVPFGESSFLVELSEVFDETIAARALAIADQWDLGTAIPAYASVVLSFDAARTKASDAERRISELIADTSAARPRAGTGRVIEIPTRYDGPDLADVASLSKLSVDELIALHSGREYTAYFLGFLPGWAYCGRLDPRIKAPRLESPRPRISPGTVAVADGQTGVYSYPSPGGWRLIGSTSVLMFDPARDEPSLLRAGDRVRFVPT